MNRFSIKRFLLLLRKYIKENGRSQLLLFTAGMGFIFVMYGLTIVANFHNEFPLDLRNVYYTVSLFLGGTFYAGNFYNFGGNQAKAIQFILLPANTLEKVLVSFVATQIGFFIFFHVGFFCIDHFLCNLYDAYVAIPSDVSPQNRIVYHSMKLDLSASHMKELIVIYFICISIFIFGSLSIKKNTFAKTLLLIFVFAAFFVYANNIMLVSLIPEQIMPKGKFINESFRLGPKAAPTAIVKLPDSWKSSLLLILPIFIYVCFWTAAYFKLKEKQLS